MKKRVLISFTFVVVIILILVFYFAKSITIKKQMLR